MVQTTRLLDFAETLHVHLEELDVTVFAGSGKCSPIGAECCFHNVCGVVANLNHAFATLQQGIAYLLEEKKSLSN